jgi:hypothetical protein
MVVEQVMLPQATLDTVLMEAVGQAIFALMAKPSPTELLLQVVEEEEVEALRKYAEELLIASMVHKDVILTEPAEAEERNSPEETEVRLGQVRLQEDKPAPSVKVDKGGLGQLLQGVVEVVDTMAEEVEETMDAALVPTAVVEVVRDHRLCLLVALALLITIRTTVMLPLPFQEVPRRLRQQVIVLFVLVLPYNSTQALRERIHGRDPTDLPRRCRILPYPTQQQRMRERIPLR